MKVRGKKGDKIVFISVHFVIYFLDNWFLNTIQKLLGKWLSIMDLLGLGKGVRESFPARFCRLH